MPQVVDVPRGGVLLNPLHAQLLAVQIERIQANTDPGEPLLTVPDIAMLNFLAERPMPGRYYNLYEHHINRDMGAGCVEDADINRVRLAVSRFSYFSIFIIVAFLTKLLLEKYFSNILIK